MSDCCTPNIIRIDNNVIDVNNLTPEDCQTLFDCILTNGTVAQFVTLLQTLDFTQLTQAQCDAILNCLDFTQLTSEQCEELFQCILDNGTQIQFDQLCASFGDIINVSTGPDGVVANATSTAGVGCDGNVHIYSPDNSVLITVVEGSAIVGLQVNPAILDGGSQVQDNTGANIPATPVDPTVNAAPIEGDLVKQVYDDGCVYSFYDGAAWINVPVLVSTEVVCSCFDNDQVVPYAPADGTAPGNSELGAMVPPAAAITINGLADGVSQTVPLQFRAAGGQLIDVDFTATGIGADTAHPLTIPTSGTWSHSNGGLYTMEFTSKSVDKCGNLIPFNLAIFANSFQTSAERWFADGTDPFVQGRDLTSVDLYLAANGTPITFPATGIHTTGINDQSDRTIGYENVTYVRAVWQAQANVGSSIRPFLYEGPDYVETPVCEVTQCLAESINENTQAIENIDISGGADTTFVTDDLTGNGAHTHTDVGAIITNYDTSQASSGGHTENASVSFGAQTLTATRTFNAGLFESEVSNGSPNGVIGKIRLDGNLAELSGDTGAVGGPVSFSIDNAGEASILGEAQTHLKTNAVLKGNATAGQVLTLIDAATGESEYADLSSGNHVNSYQSASSFNLTPPTDGSLTRTYTWTASVPGTVVVPVNPDPSIDRFWVINDSPQDEDLTIDASALLSGIDNGSPTVIPAGCKADISYDEFGEKVFVHLTCAAATTGASTDYATADLTADANRIHQWGTFNQVENFTTGDAIQNFDDGTGNTHLHGATEGVLFSNLATGAGLIANLSIDPTTGSVINAGDGTSTGEVFAQAGQTVVQHVGPVNTNAIVANALGIQLNADTSTYVLGDGAGANVPLDETVQDTRRLVYDTATGTILSESLTPLFESWTPTVDIDTEVITKVNGETSTRTADTGTAGIAFLESTVDVPTATDTYVQLKVCRDTAATHHAEVRVQDGGNNFTAFEFLPSNGTFQTNTDVPINEVEVLKSVISEHTLEYCLRFPASATATRILFVPAAGTDAFVEATVVASTDIIELAVSKEDPCGASGGGGATTLVMGHAENGNALINFTAGSPQPVPFASRLASSDFVSGGVIIDVANNGIVVPNSGQYRITAKAEVEYLTGGPGAIGVSIRQVGSPTSTLKSRFQTNMEDNTSHTFSIDTVQQITAGNLIEFSLGGIGVGDTARARDWYLTVEQLS